MFLDGKLFVKFRKVVFDSHPRAFIQAERARRIFGIYFQAGMRNPCLIERAEHSMQQCETKPALAPRSAHRYLLHPSTKRIIHRNRRPRNLVAIKREEREFG